MSRGLEETKGRQEELMGVKGSQVESMGVKESQ